MADYGKEKSRLAADPVKQSFDRIGGKRFE
jgi:hypothetical protein